MRFDGEGQPQGLPLRGTDVVVVVERVRQFGRAVPEPPVRKEWVGWGMMGKGNDKGLPLRGMDGVVVGEPVRQFGWAVPEPPVRCKLGDGG